MLQWQEVEVHFPSLPFLHARQSRLARRTGILIEQEDCIHVHDCVECPSPSLLRPVGEKLDRPQLDRPYHLSFHIKHLKERSWPVTRCESLPSSDTFLAALQNSQTDEKTVCTPHG